MPFAPIANGALRLYNEVVHEMAITRSVIEAVAERSAGRPVARVTLVVGALSGVVVDSVRFCFDLATAGTALEGATLEVVEVPGRGRCRTCDREVALPDIVALCPCGSADLEIVAGEELAIESAEVLV